MALLWLLAARGTAIGPPVNSLAPVLSGDTSDSGTLTCPTGTWSGSPTSYAYQWKRNATNVGTNANTYTKTSADDGTTITCVVTASNASGPCVTPATSNGVAVVAPGVPVNSVAPSISGDTIDTGTLTCAPGTWSNSPTFAYQWKRDGSSVGTNSTTYTKTSADDGAMMTCVVTATNAGISSGPVTSNAVGPIAAPGALDMAQPAFNKVPVDSGTVVTVTGADPTGVADSSSFFEAASTTFRGNNGGTYRVPAGTYLIGRQTYKGAGWPQLDGVPSIDLHGCTNKVIIDVRGCTFKTNPSLKFGAFDPGTGLPIDITTFAAGAYPHPPIDYACQIGDMIDITGNTDVEVWGAGPSGTLFDGNVDHINIGGLWHAAGDGGRALQHYGIWVHENDKFQLFNGATGKHFCTDALTIGWVGMNGTRPQKYHYVENFHSFENGRLGFSWVGGNHLWMVWCESRRNSLVGFTNGIQSVPSSGMDFENETSFTDQDAFSLYGGTFTRCIWSDNFACGLISASGQSRQSNTFNYNTFDAGHGFTAIVPSARYWVFNHSLFIGAMTGAGPSLADMIANGGAGIDAESPIYNDCTFSVHASDSLAGLTHEWGDSGAVAGVNTFAGAPQISIAGYKPNFYRCTFNIDNWLLGPNEDATTANYHDCTFNGPQSGAAIWGNFYGTNDFNYAVPYPGYGTIVQNLTHAINHGTIRVNGVIQ